MKPKPSILIIGDWFIDENWLMSHCDIYHSYNVGEEHFMSLLNDTTSSIQSLCGVASILRMLHGSGQMNQSKGEEVPPIREKYDLIGAGVWNPDDSDILRCIVCPKPGDKKSRNPYILSGPGQGDKTSSCPHEKIEKPCDYKTKIHNLVTDAEEGRKMASTNRLVRIYEGFGSDQPKLRFRFDWRLDIDPGSIDLGVLDRIHSEANKESHPVEAVVIVDHGYGVITVPLVERLLKLFPRANYYVRAKLASPQWFEAFAKRTSAAKKNCAFRLIFIDEQLVAYKYGTRIWQHSTSVVGRGALEVLSELLGLPWFEHGKKKASEGSKTGAENAAVLFDDNSVILAARSRGGKDASLANLYKPRGNLPAIRVGRSSVFFATLIYYDLMHQDGLSKLFKEACERAEKNSYAWMLACTGAWNKEQPDNLSGPFEEAIFSVKRESAANAPSELEYNTSWNEWNESSQVDGVISVAKDPQIQLWRAYGVLKNYICTGGEKRSAINRLIHSLGEYWKDRKPRFPFNCLFLAEPGWGKSFLARCLSEHFEFEFLRYSIAQMASNADLIDAFKVISSTQNRTRKKVLVFVDEIDAMIENHSAMGLLLGPMWDGQFKVEGNLYSIAPCIWVFASSKPVEKLMEDPKGRDFLSRINGPIIDLDFLSSNRTNVHEAKDEATRNTLMKEALRNCEYLRTEMVYHGVSLLNRLFGPISKVDRGVLEIFYKIMPRNGIRSLEVFVSRFANISRGRVTMQNVPHLEDEPDLKRHIDKLEEKWPEYGKIDQEVKVLSNPPK